VAVNAVASALGIEASELTAKTPNINKINFIVFLFPMPNTLLGTIIFKIERELVTFVINLLNFLLIINEFRFFFLYEPIKNFLIEFM